MNYTPFIVLLIREIKILDNSSMQISVRFYMIFSDKRSSEDQCEHFF